MAASFAFANIRKKFPLVVRGEGGLCLHSVVLTPLYYYSLHILHSPYASRLDVVQAGGEQGERGGVGTGWRCA